MGWWGNGLWWRLKKWIERENLKFWKKSWQGPVTSWTQWKKWGAKTKPVASIWVTKTGSLPPFILPFSYPKCPDIPLMPFPVLSLPARRLIPTLSLRVNPGWLNYSVTLIPWLQWLVQGWSCVFYLANERVNPGQDLLGKTSIFVLDADIKGGKVWNRGNCFATSRGELGTLGATL